MTTESGEFLLGNGVAYGFFSGLASYQKRFLVTIVSLLLAPNLWAKDITPDASFVPGDIVEEIAGFGDVEEDLGWDSYLRTGLSGSFAGSNNVIGSIDGNTYTLGGSVHQAWYYITRLHEWRNDTQTSQTFTRTPVLDDWVKSSDELEYVSIYFYRLPEARWVGPFSRLRLKTQLFPGTDVRQEEVTYLIQKADGTQRTVVADRLQLTQAFSPLTIRQSLGAFLKPLTPSYARLEALVGVGARQTYADGQLFLTDRSDTGVFEVTELQSFNQAGTELSLNLSGEIDGGRVLYVASAEMMTPFLNDLSTDDQRSYFDLTNMEFRITLSFRPLTWLSVDYQLQALREPQLLEEFQITNRLLVGISYTLIEKSHGL